MRWPMLAICLLSCVRSSKTQIKSGGAEASTAAFCPAATVDAFQPAAWIAPHSAKGVCSDVDLDDYLRDCLVEATAIPIACQQFVANHAACANCLLPADSTGGEGVLRNRAGGVEVNVGGCIAIVLGDSRPTGCGAREQAARDCATFACSGCTDASGCAVQARQNACSEYQLRTCGELAGAAPCALDRGFADDYRAVAKIFCGA